MNFATGTRIGVYPAAPDERAWRDGRGLSRARHHGSAARSRSRSSTITTGDDLSLPKAQARLEREAGSWLRSAHPNIARSMASTLDGIQRPVSSSRGADARRSHCAGSHPG